MLTEIGEGLMTHHTHQKFALQGGGNHQTRPPIEVNDKPVDDKHHGEIGNSNVSKFATPKYHRHCLQHVILVQPVRLLHKPVTPHPASSILCISACQPNAPSRSINPQLVNINSFEAGQLSQLHFFSNVFFFFSLHCSNKTTPLGVHDIV